MTASKHTIQIGGENNTVQQVSQKQSKQIKETSEKKMSTNSEETSKSKGTFCGGQHYDFDFS